MTLLYEYEVFHRVENYHFEEESTDNGNIAKGRIIKTLL